MIWNVRRRSPGRQFEDVEPTSPSAVEPGIAEVEGTVRPVEDPLTAPLSEQSAVASAWRVEEWNHHRTKTKRQNPLAVGDGNWFVPAKDAATVPFEVIGEHGRIEVDPTEATVVDENATAVVEVEYDETPPDAVSRFLSARDVPEPREPPWDNYDLWNRVQGDRKYVEGVIEPGERVFVHGRARERSDGSLVLDGREDGEYELVVSRYGKRPTVAKLTRSSRPALLGWLAAGLGGFTLAVTVAAGIVL